MKSTTFELNKISVERGIDFMVKLFPEDASKLNEHRSSIIEHIVSGTEPETSSPLRSMTIGGNEDDEFDEKGVVKSLDVSKCEEQIAWTVVDVIFFALSFVGLKKIKNKRAVKAILKSKKKMHGFKSAIKKIKESKDATSRALAIFSLISRAATAGGFKLIVKMCLGKLSFWDKIKEGIIIVAQIAAWFATEGVGFVAEISLTVMSAEQLFEDAVLTCEVCG